MTLTYNDFCKIIKSEEADDLDYKIECNAFQKNNEEHNAELAKDIIAFSNNGYKKNYLVIGVSNNRKGFKSVENTKLTDQSAFDRLQRFCRDNIFPHPSLKLHKLICPSNNKIKKEHRDKTFLIIQIGPHIRQCFRFNKDFIDYSKNYCFKKNEVWIRRGATSDLASPDEIKRLTEGKAPIEIKTIENNVEYTRLNRYEFENYIKEDLKKLLTNYNAKFLVDKDLITKQKDSFGGTYASNVKYNVVQLKIDKYKVNLRLWIVSRSYGQHHYFQLSHDVSDCLCHGLLVISLDKINSNNMRYHQRILSEPAWGYFGTIFDDFHFGFEKIILPKKYDNYSENFSICIALSNIGSTEKLHRRWDLMINTLKFKSDIRTLTTHVAKRAQKCIQVWVREGCPISVNNKSYFEKPKNLKRNEYWNEDKYGSKIVLKQPALVKKARIYLKSLI